MYTIVRSTLTAAIIIALASITGCATLSDKIQSGSSSASEQRAKNEATMPHCPRPIGSAAIVEPDHNWWQQIQLQSPEALIKLFVLKSGCFTIVDRGRGFALAERERALASNGDLRRGSNIGKGQVKAADFLITPDIVSDNNNAGGNAVGALLGTLVPGIGGIIASNLSLSEKSADVTLSVTDTRSSEEVAMTEGKASKTDIGFGVGGGILAGSALGGAGVSSYANTAIGQVVAMAYLDAFRKMVTQLGGLSPNTTVAATASPQRQTATMARMGHLFYGPSVSSGIIRVLPAGIVIYPDGKKSGVWEEVTDSSGKRGWVSTRMLQQ